MFHANLQLLATVRHSDDLTFGSDTRAVKLSQIIDLTEGAGDNQAQTEYVETRTLASGANEDLNLLSILPDIINPSLTPSKLRALIFVADSLNLGSIVFKPSASNGFQGPFNGALGFTIKPGGIYCNIEPLGAGWALDSTHNSINVANGGADGANYTIWAIAA